MDSKETRQNVNRFVSTLSGAFRAFFIYKHDNKALDEIMQNLLFRFQNVGPDIPELKLGISNRSLVFQGDAVGFQEVTIHLAAALRSLGFKGISFRPPLQNRHFFQLLNILANKEAPEAKLEKLMPLIGVGDQKPITLIPVTSNSLILRLSDEDLIRKLAPLAIPKDQGGSGFLEAVCATPPLTLPDFYTRVCVKASLLDDLLRAFVRDLTDAAREGYFPWNRFFRVFPLPEDLKVRLLEPLQANAPRSAARWITPLVAFSPEEMRTRQDAAMASSPQSLLQELTLAESLVSEAGANFLIGLRFILRFLGTQQPVAIQEKALKLGMKIWIQSQMGQVDSNLMSLLGSLRQNLSSLPSMTLTLFPLRSLTIESDSFKRITQYILSLGEAALPSLVQALDGEQDRGMRKKLCHLITLIVRERGSDFLIESVNSASAFLLRNIVMILGDARTPQAVQSLISLTAHPQKIVRAEAMRSLVKIGTSEASDALRKILTQSTDPSEQKVALDFLLQAKDRRLLEVLIRLAKQESLEPVWRRTLYSSIATLGGLQAKQFLESLQQSGSMFSRFGADQKEDQALIATLLKRMAAS